MGISEWSIFWKHKMKNSLIPLLSILGSQLPALLTGAFIVEIIFSIPGIGSLLIASVLQRDLPMLRGLVIINGAMVIAIQAAVELSYPLVDPRMARRGG